MSFPIQPLMHHEIHVKHHGVTVIENTEQSSKFLKAFAHRLRCLTKSSQIFEKSADVQSLHEQLLVQFHIYDSLVHELGWLFLCQTQFDIAEKQSSTDSEFALIQSMKQCYQHIHEITQDSLQDILLSLKGALHIMSQYSEMIPQRQADFSVKKASMNQRFSVLESMQKASDTYANQADAIAPRVFDLLDINPHIMTPIQSVNNAIPVNADGSVNLSDIRPFIVDSMFHADDNNDVYLECPMWLTECPLGTEMAVLYHCDDVDSIQDLFEYPQKHYCFSVLAAEQLVSNGKSHPITRGKINNYVVVRLDSVTKQVLDEREPRQTQGEQFNQKIQTILASLEKKAEDLLGLCDDMVIETLPLHQQLETLVAFFNGDIEAIDDAMLQEQTLQMRLDSLKQFKLAYEQYQLGMFEAIGYTESLGRLIQSIGNLHEEVITTDGHVKGIVISLHESGLDGLSRDLQDVLLEASEFFPEHKDVYGELYDLQMMVKKLIIQLEQRLASYRTQLARLLQLSQPQELEKQLIRDCELSIQQLTQELSGLSFEV